MPRALPILTVAALAVALVGCSSADPDTTSTPTDGATADARTCAASGPESDAVSVTGDFGALPTVDFDAPLEPDTTQVSVVSDGTGEEVPYPSVISVDYSFYDGTTGDVIESTNFTSGEEAVFVLDESQLLPGLLKTIECAEVGSRVVGVSTSDDGFGDDGLEDYGIAGGDSLVFVVDIVSAVTRAEGEAQDPVAGMPTVELDADGAPTVTIPDDYTLPTTTQSAVLIQGAGAQVQATDQVYIQYQGINAETGEIFDQTWGRAPYGGSASNFIAGFTNTLVGQNVGSQFLVVIPPADGYGEASDDNTNALAGQTLVFVVDVLAAVPTA
ncbi:FKBP-type peptidyl-prolyl cis-trans isomerase [Protaetiibacter mangrovi]|uniref:peptidylprolyl isomerase n=1 Tax=Protaetiibacter mangrovi TaxID=2970926 RepID=A0ABT1ZFE5_9MICO|nr:FKBP-type peptidyl-prolyl cis-trans isomerase [Protaetiibacter mangrovi]MCS0499417.1 FKBP-type peptidyl-prolyl cis-trans isomerase [Protaetiibacter mangrovi]